MWNEASVALQPFYLLSPANLSDLLVYLSPIAATLFLLKFLFTLNMVSSTYEFPFRLFAKELKYSMKAKAVETSLQNPIQVIYFI